ncbi:PREDICTED: IQ domain-containing protein G-like [Trachymyrmex cornetzi]|uniref:IQ domain-containing protein G-like n=1 Tax=Trachymyrmex cornetzi TaxID=471704 RepID=UPI00084F0AAE|nr:PREDICTED: IQ domain-containing protein G-like [Trachymyrmex cornetzi]XP_018363545.1 PREDICTED: IQ domain-containing protein G-like [Trachymyrmex cornetzi]
MMVNELEITQDEQTFQKEIALNRLSSITLQQARRNVIHVDDESTKEHKHTIEKTLKKSTDMFIQNLNKISKIDVKDKKLLDLIESETPLKLPESPKDTVSSKTSKDEIQNAEMKVPPFTPLEAAAISSVLEECLNQLAIIGFIIPANIDPRWDDSFKTIDETYGVPDEPEIIFREDMGLLPIVPTKAEKLQRERNYVCEVLKKVLHEIRNHRTFDSLQKEVDNIAKKLEGERNLEESAQMWLNRAEQLREQLESDKKANEEDRKSTIKLAQESDARVDHAIFINSGKLGYAEKWAKARLEQQELKLNLQNRDMLNKLSEYSKEYNTEHAISSEIHTYLEADIKEKEEQIDIWTKKYNKEIVERQEEIDELKKLIEEEKLEIEEMHALMDKRQKFINECIAEENRLKEEEKLSKAATVIQSTWRGHMVREQLGKYKGLWKQLKKRKRSRQKRKA